MMRSGKLSCRSMAVLRNHLFSQCGCLGRDLALGMYYTDAVLPDIIATNSHAGPLKHARLNGHPPTQLGKI